MFFVFHCIIVVDQWVKDELTDAGLPYVCRDKTQVSDAKRDKMMHVMHKRKRNRRRKPSSESIEDDHHANDSTAVPARRMHQLEEEPEDSSEPGPGNDRSENSVITSVNPVILKTEPVDAPTDTGSLVGNMPYRSGRRFSSSSSSSEESDAEPCSKGSYSP